MVVLLDRAHGGARRGLHGIDAVGRVVTSAELRLPGSVSWLASVEGLAFGGERELWIFEGAMARQFVVP